MISKTHQVTRYGAYGLLLQDSTILLTLKESGPYKGLWGLPGGAIEFGETPEDALKRELLEEICMQATQFKLLSIATSIGEYKQGLDIYQFHHIGILYEVYGLSLVDGLIPEEESRWFALNDLKQEMLTPFAGHILKENQNVN